MTSQLEHWKLPVGWELAPIGKKFVFTRKPRSLRFEHYERVPFISMDRIPSDRLFFSDFALMAPSDIASGTYFEEGDLLVSKITPCFENGKQGIVRNIPGGFGIATTEVVPIKPIEGVSHLPFLAMYLLHRDIRSRLAGKMEGATGRQRLPKVVLEEWTMPFPPLPEQSAITAVLSKIQVAMEVQDKIVAKLKELKAATMAKLFREGLIKGLMFDSNVFDDLIDGKLDFEALPKGVNIYVTHIQRDELGRTPDDNRRGALQTVLRDMSEGQIPTSSFVLGTSRLDQASIGDGDIFHAVRGRSLKNTNDALIAETAVKKRLVLVTNEKTLRERVRAVGGESISTEDLLARRPRPVKQTEIGEIPESWEVMRLGEVASIERGKFAHRPRNAPRFYGGVTPFIQTGDVAKSNGRIRTYSQTLNEEGLAISRLFPKGTIVLTIAANIADTGILEFDSAFPDSLVGITPDGTMDAAFLEYYLRTQKADMDRLAPKGTQKNINISFLKPWLTPRPSIEEQQEIAHDLRCLDDKLAIAFARRDTLKALFSSMLHLLMTGRVRITPEMIALKRVADRERQREAYTGTVDEKLLKEIVRRIVGAVAPEKIILFGSAARGEMGPDSDLDLLIVKSGAHRLATAQTIEHSLIGITIPTDIVVATPRDIEVHKNTIGLIYRPALQEGKILYAA